MISRILLLLCIVFFIQSNLRSQIDLSLSKKAKIGSVKLSGALNDFNGNLNTVTILFQPQFGTVEIASDGCMYYFPGSGSGEQVLDSFTYQICADNDPTDCRQVETRVQIGDGSDFFACEDGYELDRNTVYNLDVLANDINADPSTLNIILSPISGTISDISVSNGQVILQTNNYQGQTEFLYSVQSAIDGSSDVVKVSLLIGNSSEFVAVADCRYVIPGTTVLQGEAVCYQIDVTNSGGEIATGVIVEDVLPSAIIYDSSEPAGEYSAISGEWVLADIAPDETETLTIIATVDESGNIENCAQVIAADQNDGDSTPNNNIATEDDQDCATIVGIIFGCTDQCAPNYNPQANEEDGSCETYSTTCNTDCQLGDIETWDPNSCSCVVIPTILGCTNTTACNYVPGPNCNDGSCIFETTCDNDPCTNGGIYAWDATTCECELDIATVLGCADPTACNYVPGPNCNDGSCIFETTCDNDPCTNGGIYAWDATTCECELDIATVLGCADPAACNYVPGPNCNDGSCIFETTCDNDPCTNGGIYAWDATTCECELDIATVLGCTNAMANNFDATANCDDGSCEVDIVGCTNPCAPNYNPDATVDGNCANYDDTCNSDCLLGDIEEWNATTCSCEIDVVTVSGCTSPAACNFDATANCDDGSCTFAPCNSGCTDPCAANFDATADADDGSCDPVDRTCNTDCTLGDLEIWNETTCSCEVMTASIVGCTDANADNFNAAANCDDGSCIFTPNGLIDYVITETADGCYQVSLISGQDWVGNDGITSTAQITLVIASDGFVLSDLTSVNGIWSNNSTILNPSEKPDFEYYTFGLVGLGTIDITYIAGQEEVLFTFCNAGECTTSITLMETDDLFAPPNSEGVNVGNQLTTLGSGNINAWSANQGEIIENCNAVGCTDPCAPNYNADALEDDGTCETYDATCNTDCTLGDITAWDAVTCSCEVITAITQGCTTPAACNFDATVNCDDGSCLFAPCNPGCTDPCAPNYNADALEDDGSCETYDATCNTDCTLGDLEIWNETTCSCEVMTASIVGCTDANADNFNAAANCDDGSCVFDVLGCTDPCAPNYDATADADDGSCEAYDTTCNTDCTLGDLEIWNETTCSCEVITASIVGCTDANADNFNAAANCDDGSCVFDVLGCTDPCAPNYDATADADNGSCAAYDTTCNTDCTLGDLEIWNETTCSCEVITASIVGCTDANADNFNAAANCDDGSCVFDVLGCTDPCAPNYDATADADNGSCAAYDTTCNINCDLGDLEIWDTETCSCIPNPINNCDDPLCQNFTAIDAALCEIGALDYEVMISISGGTPDADGYIITDNNTGVVFGPFNSNNLVLGPYAVPTGYSFTVAVANNPTCFEVLELSAVDCQTTAIELLRFDSQVESNGNAISWTTATEKDSKLFVVQHSKNGIDFAKVGSINAMGNSNESNDYNFLHANVETGTHYYRLSEVDVFGTERIVSDVIALNRKADLQIVQLYPVPTQSFVNLEFVVDIEQQIVVKIFDITGRIITEETRIASKGINQISIDARSYSVGNYFIQISGNDTNIVERFIRN